MSRAGFLTSLLALVSCATEPPPDGTPPVPLWSLPVDASVSARVLDIAAAPPDAAVGGLVVLASISGSWRVPGIPSDVSDGLVLARLAGDGTSLWTRVVGAPLRLPEFGRLGAFETDTLRVTMDGSGGVTFGGAFDASVWIRDTQEKQHELRSKGGLDAFVAGRTAAGDHAWFRDTGGPLDDAITALATTTDGLLLAGGTFRGTVPIAPGTAQTARGGSDVFVANLVPGIGLTRVITAGGPRDDSLGDVSTSADGAFISATFRDELRFGDAAPILGFGDDDGALVHLDERGLPTWSVVAGGAGQEIAGRLAPTGGGVLWSVFVAPGARVGLVAIPRGGHVVARVDEHGQVVWTRSIAHARGSRPLAIAAFEDGSIALAGDGLVASLAPDGTERWRSTEPFEARAVVAAGPVAVFGGHFAGASAFGVAARVPDADVVKGLVVALPP